MKFYCAKCGKGKAHEVSLSEVSYRKTKNKREQAVAVCPKHGSKLYKLVKTGTALRRSSRKSGRRSSRKRS
jgi:hypothetical protein